MSWMALELITRKNQGEVDEPENLKSEFLSYLGCVLCCDIDVPSRRLSD